MATAEERAAHLEALDGMLGYMSLKLKNADYTSEFVRGYVQAKSDLAHVRSALWFDWHREDPEGAAAHKLDWESVHEFENLGTHRIFPKEKNS